MKVQRDKGNNPVVSLLCIGQEGEHNELAHQFAHDAVKMLENNKIAVVGGREEVLITPKEILDAAQKGKEMGAHAQIFLIGTWILCDKVIDTIREVDLPLGIWGIPEAISFSSVGANVVHGTLEEMEIRHELFYGFAREGALQEELIAFVRAAKAVRRLRTARLGMLGGRSISAYPTTADPNQIKRVFGTEVQHIDQLILLERARGINAARVAKAEEQFRDKFENIDGSPEIIDKSLRVYLALQDIKDEYRLDFLAVKCLEEFIEEYTSCCLAIALLNDDNVVTACQSDLNAALSMFLVEDLSGEPSIFGDVNTVDKKTGVARMINCGTMATRLAGDGPVEWVEQYDYMGAGRGLCPLFCCKSGATTFGTLSRVGTDYTLLIARGEAYTEQKEMYTQVRTWAQGFISMDGDPMEIFSNIRSNHSVVGYGDLRKELRYVGQILGIKVVEV